MLKKMIAASIFALGATVAVAQAQPPAPKPTATSQVSQPFDPYSFCYIKSEAYSEGTVLEGYGKCMAKPVADETGKRRLYWESNFYKQR